MKEIKPPIIPDTTLRDFWRGKLSGVVLDELFEEAKTCGHEGACWDLVNTLADILTPHTQNLLKDQLDLLAKKLPEGWKARSLEDVEDSVKVAYIVHNAKVQGFNAALSEVRAIIEGKDGS